MSKFTRKTIIEVVATIEAWSHSEIDRFMLDYGLEDIAGKRSPTMSRQVRANALITLLLKNPNATTENGLIYQQKCDVLYQHFYDSYYGNWRSVYAGVTAA